MFKRSFLSMLSILGATQLWAQSNDTATATSSKTTFLDEVIVSDSRFGLKRSQSGRYVLSIDPETIQQAQGLSIGELLTTYAGIDIIGNRTHPGQNLTASIRGGRNKNVLILIDGVRMSNPTQIDSDFDLNFIDLAQVERIEVIKGAASTLYGSSAAAGVINIITKKVSSDAQVSLRATTGSVRAAGDSFQPFSSRELGVNTSGKLMNDQWRYALGVSHAYADGMSAVQGPEIDPFERTNLNFRLEGRPSENFSWKLSLNKDNVLGNFDATWPAYVDADNKKRMSSNRVSLSPVWINSQGTFGANLSYQDTYRDLAGYESQGQYTVADLYQKWSLASDISVLTGYQFQEGRQAGIPDASITQSDFYVQGAYVPENGLQLHAGVRYNANETYGDHWSIRLNPSLRLGAWQLGFSYNTAFIAPSLYQVYNPTVGTRDLTPETTINKEINLQWTKQQNFVNLALFNRKETDAVIYYTPPQNSNERPRYINQSGTRAYQGIEIQGKQQFSDAWSLDYQYTYLETDGGDLTRLPKHAGLLQMNYKPSITTRIALSYQHQGSRPAYGTGERLSPFDLWHLSASIQTQISGLRLTLNLRNLLDKEYIEQVNYLSRGRQVLFGITYALQ